MKRRKRDEGGSLDSLLDTMTTVVGILIILLIVVQLGADSAVNRIVEEQKQEDAKELEEMAMSQFEDQRRALIGEKERLENKAAEQNKDARLLLKELSDLQKNLSQVQSTMTDLAKWKKDLQTRTKVLAAAEQEAKNKSAELKRLKALIAKIPEPSAAVAQALK